MREVNVNVEVSERKLITEIKKAVKEELYYINEYKQSKLIEVGTALLDENGEIIKNNNYEISGDKYDLLMEESPEFAPQKPANEYRTTDLWYIIDLIRGEQ